MKPDIKTNGRPPSAFSGVILEMRMGYIEPQTEQYVVMSTSYGQNQLSLVHKKGSRSFSLPSDPEKIVEGIQDLVSGAKDALRLNGHPIVLPIYNNAQAQEAYEAEGLLTNRSLIIY